jgi:hypothetical protein
MNGFQKAHPGFRADLITTPVPTPNSNHQHQGPGHPISRYVWHPKSSKPPLRTAIVRSPSPSPLLQTGIIPAPPPRDSPGLGTRNPQTLRKGVWSSLSGSLSSRYPYNTQAILILYPPDTCVILRRSRAMAGAPCIDVADTFWRSFRLISVRYFGEIAMVPA